MTSPAMARNRPELPRQEPLRAPFGLSMEKLIALNHSKALQAALYGATAQKTEAFP